MSTRAKIASAAASAGVLLLGWNIGTANGATLQSTPTQTTTSTATTQVVASNTSAATTASTVATASQAASAATSSATSTSTSSAVSTGWKTCTYTGTTSSDRYGSVTVTITITDGRITNATAKTVANDNHSAQINSMAVPTLRSEVLSAQSANISSVSGATYTSQAYMTSLQSALDQAK